MRIIPLSEGSFSIDQSKQFVPFDKKNDDISERSAGSLLVEVQRSIDLWERTWTQWPLAGFQVFAGERSAELAEWLSRDTGQNVSALEVASSFAGWDTVAESDRPLCLPLLGILLRGDA